MSGQGDEVTVIRAINPLLDSREEDEIAYVVVLSGTGVGQMERVVKGQLTVGRHPDNDLVVDDEGVSRRHAAIVTDQFGVSSVRDLKSTNGTFVESRRVQGQVELRDGDRIRVGPGTIIKYGYRDTVERQFLKRLYRSATRDGLTGLFKREYFEEQLRTELSWHRRHNQPLSLLMLDIDHFKVVNDRYGHNIGDKVLGRVSEFITRCCRAEDLVARYGGEEFVVVLRATARREAQNIAERICETVRTHTFDCLDEDQGVTISVGVCTRDGASLVGVRELVAEADRLLYEAKRQGRDQAVVGS